LKQTHGFKAHKLKSGVFPPDYELEVFRALAKAVGKDTVRYDPNAAFSVEEAIRFAKGIEDLNNDYFEDPTWGLNGMLRVRGKHLHAACGKHCRH
jgi:glucarate dehydratase